MNPQHNISPDTEVFQRLSYRYFLALGIIALVIFFGNSFVNSHLESQIGDSRIINLSGRQRMLSQQLAKQALHLSYTDEVVSRVKLKQEIEATLNLWKKTHMDLLDGKVNEGSVYKNSSEIIEKFKSIEGSFQEMKNNGEVILEKLGDNPAISKSILNPNIKGILQAEPRFLAGMNEIVFQYDLEAKSKVQSLRSTENVIMSLGFGVLLLELLLIFWPSAKYVQKWIKQLTDAKQESEAKSEEVQRLFAENEKANAQLKALNHAVDKALLFASINLDGRIVYVSEKLAALMSRDDENPRGSIADYLSTKDVEQQIIDQTIRSLRTTVMTKEHSITTKNGTEKWLEISYVPINRKDVDFDFLIVCHDITENKLNQKEIDELRQSKFDKEMEDQKIRSKKVIKAQEEERERIAKDIHDSIGQMLTSLKFNIEGINLDNIDRASTKLDEIKLLASNVIKGVRLATFNLNPPELIDYGIVAALKKLSTQTTKLSGRNIHFVENGNLKYRFDNNTETNIYRICQEAVNNALKYAQAENIAIAVSHDQYLFSVVVEDDGVGFDMSSLSDEDIEAKENSGHLGLSFMKERAELINGRLFIRSEVGQGTRITLNVPIPSAGERLSRLTNDIEIEHSAW